MLRKKVGYSLALLAGFVIISGAMIGSVTWGLPPRPGPPAAAQAPAPALAVAAEGQWQSLTPTPGGPGPRYDHALAYHAGTDTLYLFGGRDGSSTHNDVWALDLSNLSSLTWVELAASSASKPSARHSTVMIVDDAGQNLYIATGQLQGGGVLSDVWRLNLSSQERTTPQFPAR